MVAASVVEPAEPVAADTILQQHASHESADAACNPQAGSVTLTAMHQPEPAELCPPTAPAALLNSEEIPAHAGLDTPIDLSSALAIAAGDNPQVAFAQQRVAEAFAQLRSAQILWVPSIRAGANYNKHEGTIQDVAGNIIETSRGSVYTGFGAQAVGAGSPAVPGLLVNFHTRDAIFQPRIAERTIGARRQAERTVLYDLLTDTALAYTDLLEAAQLVAVQEETLANTQGLADLTASFARTGQGLAADADRARAELSLQQIEARRAAETVQVASARLAQLLSQDPTQTLLPMESAIVPIELVPFEQRSADLIATGLTNRPELAESRWLVAAAVERLRRECYAPLVPSVLLGLSYGGNGGGLGSDIENFGDRMDFDAVAFWEIRSLGVGEQAAREQARSQVAQARWQQVQLMDQVASEVAQAHAQVTARRQQIALAQQGISAASDSYRRNTERIRNSQGLPIETLQSIQALNSARRQYVRAVADYNRAQFALQRALGWPISVPASE
jgi:outer membrane protein TolC